MRAIRQFEDFVKEGIVKIQKVNESRAEFLIKEAESSYAFLQEKINMSKTVMKYATDFSQ